MRKTDKRQMRKSTKAEVELRVGQVAKLILNGWNKESIVLYSAQNWNVALRQTTDYMQTARERIKQSVQKDITLDYAIALNRFEELYRLSKERDDIRTAVSINKELVALQGLSKDSASANKFHSEADREKDILDSFTNEELLRVETEEHKAYQEIAKNKKDQMK